jgi:hypothetical protein
MDHVEGLVRNLKLMDAEKQGVKISGVTWGGRGSGEPHEVSKLLANKPTYVDAMATTLGRVWCPMKGLSCEDLVDNINLFTFHQVGGDMYMLSSILCPLCSFCLCLP